MTAARPLPAACVVLAAVVAGLLFAPVFGVAPMLAPLLATAAAVVAVVVLAGRREAMAPWRPLFALLAGLVAIVETALPATTAAGCPPQRPCARSSRARRSRGGWSCTRPGRSSRSPR
ncbi:hypothetical protein ACFSVJ_27640 [Prauserella oleivorans]